MNTASVRSIRWGIAAAKEDRSTFYGFYTGEHALDLYNDFLTVMPKLMFDGDELAVEAYKRTIRSYVDRMAVILEDLEDLSESV
jgi:hypothetical protein